MFLSGWIQRPILRPKPYAPGLMKAVSTSDGTSFDLPSFAVNCAIEIESAP